MKNILYPVNLGVCYTFDESQRRFLSPRTFFVTKQKAWPVTRQPLCRHYRVHPHYRVHLRGPCPALRWHAAPFGSLKCTRATSVRNLKLSCHPLAKLYGAFIMFSATVTRKLLGPKPGSLVRAGEINSSHRNL